MLSLYSHLRYGNKKENDTHKLIIGSFINFMQFASGCFVFMMIHRTLLRTLWWKWCLHLLQIYSGYLQGIHSVQDSRRTWRQIYSASHTKCRHEHTHSRRTRDQSLSSGCTASPKSPPTLICLNFSGSCTCLFAFKRGAFPTIRRTIVSGISCSWKLSPIYCHVNRGCPQQSCLQRIVGGH